MTGICFIIQPFDEKFDKRFEDTFKPSVIAAGFEPYRVDRDPSAAIPIDAIENSIKASTVCLADITTDNPNVWCELGMAIAFGKPLCLLSSKERTSKYPFDVQHRQIIGYSIDSKSDYDRLGQSIINRLKSVKSLDETRTHLVSSPIVKDSEGLQPHDIACLATLAAETSGMEASVSNWVVKNSMESAGFNRLATQVAIFSLVEKRLIHVSVEHDRDGETYEVYALTINGWSWIRKNLDQFSLSHTPEQRKVKRNRDLDDEVPF